MIYVNAEWLLSTILTKDWQLTDPTSRQRGHRQYVPLKNNLWSKVPDWARYQNILTDWPSVVMWLWLWPPLWSSGQSSWLQIQRSGFDSRIYQLFWEVAQELGPPSLLSTIEELLKRKRSSSGQENREYGLGIRPADHMTLPLSVKVGVCRHVNTTTAPVRCGGDLKKYWLHFSVSAAESSHASCCAPVSRVGVRPSQAKWRLLLPVLLRSCRQVEAAVPSAAGDVPNCSEWFLGSKKTPSGASIHTQPISR
jgi:hypothetical protein